MDIVIHVGLHRTGSTFLQKEVFPKLQNVNYVYRYNMNSRNQLLAVKLDENKINLISEEGLTRHNFRDDNETSMIEISNRIYRVFPDARIILVLRDKKEWLNSLYKMNCRYSFDSWFDNIFNKDDLDFDGYVDHIRGLFSDVLVLDYGLLRDDPNVFVKQVCDFIGVNVPVFSNRILNKSLDLVVARRISRIPNYLRYFLLPILRCINS